MINNNIGGDTIALDITTTGTTATINLNGVPVITLSANGTAGYPSYTTTERDALTGLAAGQTVYNETTNKLNFYNGSAWQAVTSA